MIRTISSELLLFFLPFIVFAFWLAVRQRAPFDWVHWEDRIGKLMIAGLVLAALAFVFEGAVAERSKGVYVPAHMENGQFVPGGFR